MYVTLTIDPVTRSRKIERHGGTPNLHTMQNAVGGGYITTGFCIPSPSGKGRTIDFYVNDEGLLISGNPVMGYFDKNKALLGQLAGNGIFTATDYNTGETVPMTDAEVSEINTLRCVSIGTTR